MARVTEVTRVMGLAKVQGGGGNHRSAIGGDGDNDTTMGGGGRQAELNKYSIRDKKLSLILKHKKNFGMWMHCSAS